MKDRLIRYSMQIAMLGQLLSLALITEKEFTLIKNKLMHDYGIISDLTS
ncbi:hypothetical protein DES36_12326 [Alkalibaculum bacchi]|jgi:hypothetical protein|uniref:Conjugal transfer protein n=1 Tax=Alkalibaculum bacchi TaxID=645887 RepID=A0A366HZX8_9FIRM|nr:conjugal transfer protein [Alkalibaculum bacchi]RBP58457.1 hypothetical protein DES36_12326 [Alkalibaculum bacchi]